MQDDGKELPTLEERIENLEIALTDSMRKLATLAEHVSLMATVFAEIVPQLQSLVPKLQSTADTSERAVIAAEKIERFIDTVGPIINRRN
jgi:uncharacterized coiled-coil protein SlyX